MASFKRIIIAAGVGLFFAQFPSVQTFAQTPSASIPLAQARSASSRFILERLLDGRHITNVVDDFLIFWDQAKHRTPNIQRRLWQHLVEDKHRQYFDRAVYRTTDPDIRAAMLDEFLIRVPSQVEAIREFNRNIYNLRVSPLVEAIISFQNRFPEYQQQRDIYIGVSMFRFDGAIRPVQNDEGVPDTLCLGAEVLSSYTHDQISIAIAHEFFHLYHFGFLFQHEIALADFRTAHMPLMIEGLAAAGAEAAFPYRQRELYLHFTREDLAAQQQDLPRNASQFLDLIQQNAPPEEYGQWFTHSHLGEAPPRGGYLLGYEVARRVMSAYTLEQMVRMTPAELREHAEEQLAAMTSEGILLIASR